MNRRLIDAVRDLEDVTVHDLYEAYPDFDIDVPHEQELLVDHDLVVFQHPFYWYSTPAMLKEWQDLVLEHGWAYGHEGKALVGKRFLSAITTGGPKEAYCAKGLNGYTIEELLRPIEQSMRLCGMDWLPPYVVHGTHRLTPDEIEDRALAYRDTLVGLRDATSALTAEEED